MTYFVNLEDTSQHMIKVEMAVDEIFDKEIIVTMPAWAPGSYLIRDFAKNIRNFTAVTADGDLLRAEKEDKGSWKILTDGNSSLRISYEVYSNDFSVRASHVDSSHAFILGTSVFMYIEGYKDQALELVVRHPEEWHISTSLEKVFENRYKAINYDILVDSPLEVGAHRSETFQADGKEHEVAIYGMDGMDLKGYVADVKKIVETEIEIFDHAPYKKYVFIFHVYPGCRSGGLEHLASCVISIDRNVLVTRDGYGKFLSLVAHEFFHLWNVKRIRPVELGPFNYREENYTTMLWLAEGITDFFADVIVLRSGLIDEKTYLGWVSELTKILEAQPGAQTTSLADSSYYTWIRYYKPSPDDINSYVSYYLKGKFIGLMLASRMVQHSGGLKTIDDLLRALYDKYKKDGKGVVDKDVLVFLKDITNSDYTDFFSKYIHGSEKINFDSEFKSMGLQLKRSYSAANLDKAGWLGLMLKKHGRSITVKGVVKGTPAYDTGINVGDELVAVNDFRFNDKYTRTLIPRPPVLIDNIFGIKPGDAITVTLFRRGELLQIRSYTAPAPYDKYELVESKEEDFGKKVRQKVLLGQIK